MDVQKYLRRIGCADPCPPTLDTLRYIHRNHLLNVPFENLTIHSGGWVNLELPSLYEKIVLQRRGGFCFENNGLFSWLLVQLGFEVTILSAQVRNRFTGLYGPPFDHFIMQVTVDGHRWLCDVGFGSGFELPLSLETDGPQKQGRGVYRLRHQGETIFLGTQSSNQSEVKQSTIEGGASAHAGMQKSDQWTELYKFTLEPRRREDFHAMCDYHQTSPSSVFFCKSLCSLLLTHGRVTYMGRKLKVTTFSPEDGQQQITETDLSDEEIPEILKEKFGIVLPFPLIPKDIEIVPPAVIY